jgi:hypothetical protein
MSTSSRFGRREAPCPPTTVPLDIAARTVNTAFYIDGNGDAEVDGGT